MSYIFISYSRRNSAFVQSLTAQLEQHHIPYWIDHRDIPHGERWQDVIQQSIKQCAAMIIVMSPESQQSEEVMIEMEIAKNANKARLPLWLEGEIFFQLSIFNCVDVRDGNVPADDDFYEHLRWHVKQASPQATTTATDDLFQTKKQAAVASPDSDELAHEQYDALRQAVSQHFQQRMRLERQIRDFIWQHPTYDPDNLVDRYLTFVPLDVDLNTTFTLDDRPHITQEHPLWRRLKQAGAELKGNQNTFPAHFLPTDGRPSTVGIIDYHVRRPFTESGNRQVGMDYSLLDAVRAGDSHPFWAEVNLPGVPYFWGAAAIVYRQNTAGRVEMLCGVKLPRTKAVQAVYANQLVNPAGMVETEDFDIAENLGQVFVKAALRELYEETGLNLNQTHVAAVETYLDLKRCKQQSYVLCPMPERSSPLDEISPELKEIGFYDLADPMVLAQHEVALECQHAYQILMAHLEQDQ